MDRRNLFQGTVGDFWVPTATLCSLWTDISQECQPSKDRAKGASLDPILSLQRRGKDLSKAWVV